MRTLAGKVPGSAMFADIRGSYDKAVKLKKATSVQKVAEAELERPSCFMTMVSGAFAFQGLLEGWAAGARYHIISAMDVHRSVKPIIMNDYNI